MSSECKVNVGVVGCGVGVLHLQGLAKDPRVGMSLDYLASAIYEHTSAPSLAFACWALRAHGRDSSHIDACIASSLARADESRLAEHELALLLLAEAAATSHALLTGAPQEGL